MEYSVIDEGVEISNIDTRLQECLIGLKARIVGTKGTPRVHRLTLSDASVLELGT